MPNKISVCGVAKNEDLYIEEWINHYLSLGVDHIFIYDNNDTETPTMRSLACSQVTIIPVRGFDALQRLGYQSGAYMHCYTKHSHEYDWMGIFDIDEFFRINELDKSGNTYSVGDWLNLSKFSETDVIHINWRYYGDNELLVYDKRPVQERFIEPAPLDVRYAQAFPENRYVKSFIKCGKPLIELNPHTGYYPTCVCMHADGYKTSASSCFADYTYNCAQVSHYGTKTIAEFIERKCFNVHRASCGEKNNPAQRIKWFFNVNKHSILKDMIANKALDILKRM